MTELETKNRAHDKAFATLYTLDTDISRLNQEIKDDCTPFITVDQLTGVLDHTKKQKAIWNYIAKLIETDHEKLTTLPKWFKGTIYDKGDTVTNPFSGEEYKLTNLELSMYDFIQGAQLMFAIHQEKQPNRPLDRDIVDCFEKALSWFRRHNGKAYMVLLD